VETIRKPDREKPEGPMPDGCEACQALACWAEAMADYAAALEDVLEEMQQNGASPQPGE
jgi:hypothetical protein